MKIKKSNLEWYVLIYDSNIKKIVDINIMYRIAELVGKNVRKKVIYDKKTLKEFLKREFMCRYWCKYEYEIAMSGLSERDFANAEKIDVWRQIEKNLDNIVEYVNIKCDLKF